MRYFFVFQNKTYREEHDGGFYGHQRKIRTVKPFITGLR